MFGLLAVAIIVVALVYIRLAPSDPAIWHKPVIARTDGPKVPDGDFARTLTGGYITGIVINLPADQALSRIDLIAASFKDTERLAGDVESGLITYVSRSKYIGFPDYTTIEVEPAGDTARLVIYGRLRFGRSDLRVNQGRIEAWIQMLNPVSDPQSTSSG